MPSIDPGMSKIVAVGRVTPRWLTVRTAAGKTMVPRNGPEVRT